MNTFSTRNIAFAAFLVAGKHLKLDRIDVDTSEVADFVFYDPNGNGQRLESDFLTQDALVPAATYYRSVRSLRGMIETTKKRNSIRNERYDNAKYANR